MTPREKILMAEGEKYKKLIKTSIKIIRMETELCRKRGWPVSVQLESLTISLEEAIKQADAIKDGPSEEDVIFLKRIVQDEFEGNIHMNSSFRWTISKLKQYMGIE